MHDDLPEPVAPETRMWGISARLTMMARPAMSRAEAHLEGVDRLLGLRGGQDITQGHQLSPPVP